MPRNVVSFDFLPKSEEFSANLYKDKEPHESSKHSKMLRIMKKIMNDSLTKKQKTCLLFYYSEKLKMTEIAKKLNLNVSSVSRHINRARNKLKKTMDYYF